MAVINEILGVYFKLLRLTLLCDQFNETFVGFTLQTGNLFIINWLVSSV